jgi:hypothetical protein
MRTDIARAAMIMGTEPVVTPILMPGHQTGVLYVGSLYLA